MTEKITVSCLREELAVCPGCGSRNIVGRDKEYCHCGQCGRSLEILITDRVAVSEEKAEDFEQLSLF
ncbi:MAG: hypothetical protein J6B43_03025 [Lachnospiraceae bacterium]|nr:hypothetical protein [Lachnospiraceae bacterium]